MTQREPATHPRSDATRAVVSRLDDLGLGVLSRVLERTPGDQLYRKRDLVLQARQAGTAIHQSALHFNQKPIVAHAVALCEAASVALLLLDGEIDAMVRANEMPAHERGGVQPAQARPRSREEDR